MPRQGLKYFESTKRNRHKIWVGTNRSRDMTIEVRDEDNVVLDIGAGGLNWTTIKAIAKIDSELYDEDVLALYDINCTIVGDGSAGKFTIPFSTSVVNSPAIGAVMEITQGLDDQIVLEGLVDVRHPRRAN